MAKFGRALRIEHNQRVPGRGSRLSQADAGESRREGVGTHLDGLRGRLLLPLRLQGSHGAAARVLGRRDPRGQGEALRCPLAPGAPAGGQVAPGGRLHPGDIAHAGNFRRLRVLTKSGEVPLHEYPNVVAWMERVEARESYKAA